MVLIHNGNKFLSVPLAYAANMKGSYERMMLLSGRIKYDEFNWKLCGDIKVGWQCYSECNSGTQNTAVSCVSGTARTRRITV